MNAIARDPALERLLAFIRDERGFDVTGYKRPSLARRISRRMQDAKVDEYASYQAYLEHHWDEFARLFDTILINVTSFFRDAPVWEWEEEDPIRIWSTGWSTGEEACAISGGSAPTRSAVSTSSTSTSACRSSPCGCRFARCSPGGDADPFTVDAVNRRGRSTTVAIRVVPLTSALAEVTGAIVIMDATDRSATGGS